MESNLYFQIMTSRLEILEIVDLLDLRTELNFQMEQFKPLHYYKVLKVTPARKAISVQLVHKD